MSAQAHADHGAPTSFVRRWLYSTNHKDIGTMYLIFAILAAFIGGGLSIYMRMELMNLASSTWLMVMYGTFSPPRMA